MEADRELILEDARSISEGLWLIHYQTRLRGL
jgi:hypothetical protein